MDKIARSIHAGLSAGDVAELRRSRLEQPPAAFWKLVSRHFEQGELGTYRLEDRWAVIVAGMAEMRSLHQAGANTGEVLAEHLHPMRFLRLIRAKGDALHKIVRTTAKHLANKRVCIDWTHLAWLVLSDGLGDEDSARRALARKYYLAQFRPDV